MRGGSECGGREAGSWLRVLRTRLLFVQNTPCVLEAWPGDRAAPGGPSRAVPPTSAPRGPEPHLLPPPRLEEGALGGWRGWPAGLGGRPRPHGVVLCQAPGPAGGPGERSQAWGRGGDGAGAGRTGGPAGAPTLGPAFRSPASHQVPMSPAMAGLRPCLLPPCPGLCPALACQPAPPAFRSWQVRGLVGQAEFHLVQALRVSVGKLGPSEGSPPLRALSLEWLLPHGLPALAPLCPRCLVWAPTGCPRREQVRGWAITPQGRSGGICVALSVGTGHAFQAAGRGRSEEVRARSQSPWHLPAETGPGRP